MMSQTVHLYLPIAQSHTGHCPCQLAITTRHGCAGTDTVFVCCWLAVAQATTPAIRQVGSLADPDPPAPIQLEVFPRKITGRAHYQRKDPKTTLPTYPAGVPVRCFIGSDELCSTTTTQGGYFECDTGMAVDGDLVYCCQFEALPGVTHRYRTRKVKGVSAMGDVTIYPDRRGLRGCTMNKCGPEVVPVGAKALQGLGLPTDGDIVVPDCWFGDFCDNHDCCYSECGVTQELCDTEMRELSSSLCRIGDGRHTPYRPLGRMGTDWCYSLGGCNEATTSLYHGFLSQLGVTAFGAAQRNCLND